MKFKKLFSVAEGSRITEKSLYRVLISSICSILLCMGSLAGTTWAWYVVSVENTGNVIEIGTASVILTTQDLVPVSQTSYWPTQADTTLHISHPNNYDDFNQKSTLYVTFSVDNTVKGYVMLNADNKYESDLRILAGNGHQLTWVVSWFAPGTVAPLNVDDSAENTYVINLLPETETEPDTNTDKTPDSNDGSVEENKDFTDSFDSTTDSPAGSQNGNQTTTPEGSQTTTPDSGSDEENTTPSETTETTQSSDPTETEEETTTDIVSTDGET